MSELLLHYEKVNPTTWVYLSSLLIIGLYFKFNRFWSVRNLDIVLLILFAPGLVLVHLGQQEQLTARPLSEKLETAVTVGNSEPGSVAVPSPTSAGNNSSPETSVSTLEQQQEVTDRLVNAEHLQRLGFIWLMVIGGLFLLRLLLDPTMVRRPLLESNLSLGGLTFLGLSMFVFLYFYGILDYNTYLSYFVQQL